MHRRLPGVGLGVVGYALLLAPYALSLALSGTPGTSYLVAWLGSWFILWMTLTGFVKPLPADRPFRHQILRPIIFTQLVFVGYNCLTSIFYVADLNGYYYLQQSLAHVADGRTLALAAEAQRYYLLAHAALVSGILVAMDYRQSGAWRITARVDVPKLMLIVAAVGFVFGQAMGFVPGMAQLQERFQAIALIASVLAFASAFPTRRGSAMIIGGAVYAANMLAAFRSGWKEEVLVMVLLLAVFAYPYYKRLVLVLAPAVVVALLVFLPAYANIVRSLSWTGEVSSAEAASIAVEQIRRGNVDIASTNWSFLTDRFSEIGLFTKYLESIPEYQPFYGWSIPAQAASSLIPRAFWPEKPNTKRLVMERVYENGVVSRESEVSAKPQFIVDGYLSAGPFGVLIACFLYGILASFASRLAERFFGGYLVGTALMYTALFRDMWRGNSFEFLANNVFWSLVIMIALFYLARSAGWLRAATPVMQEGISAPRFAGASA